MALLVRSGWNGIDDIFTGGGVLEAWFFADTFGGGGLGRLFDKNEYALFIDNTNPMAANAVTFYHECSGGNGVGWSAVLQVAANVVNATSHADRRASDAIMLGTE